MCVVSMVHDYHQKLPLDYWTPDNLKRFRELVKNVEVYDEETGQKDCIDPEKAKFLKVIEDYIKEKYGIDVTVTEK